MYATTLHYGLQEVARRKTADLRTTVGEHIEELLRSDPDEKNAAQLRASLDDPRTVIELRSGEQVQTVTADMPLRELLPGDDELEIRVSKPHAGG